jgi:hypothetical protein
LLVRTTNAPRMHDRKRCTEIHVSDLDPPRREDQTAHLLTSCFVIRVNARGIVGLANLRFLLDADDPIPDAFGDAEAFPIGHLIEEDPGCHSPVFRNVRWLRECSFL